jgi:TIR domain-containing protein
MGRVADRLREEFGGDALFVDVFDIPLGQDFRAEIAEKLSRCDAVLAIVGPNWMARDAEGRSRLDDADDYVRYEIETALKRRIPVIPVLVQQAEMPNAAQLPESLREFTFRNATRIRPDPDFQNDIERLIGGLRGGSLARHATSTMAGRRSRARLTALTTLLILAELGQVGVFLLTNADGPRQLSVIVPNVLGAGVVLAGGVRHVPAVCVAVTAIVAPWLFRLVAEPLVAVVASAVVVCSLAGWLLTGKTES